MIMRVVRWAFHTPTLAERRIAWREQQEWARMTSYFAILLSVLSNIVFERGASGEAGSSTMLAFWIFAAILVPIGLLYSTSGGTFFWRLVFLALLASVQWLVAWMSRSVSYESNWFAVEFLVSLLAPVLIIMVGQIVLHPYPSA